MWDKVRLLTCVLITHLHTIRTASEFGVITKRSILLTEDVYKLLFFNFYFGENEKTRNNKFYIKNDKAEATHQVIFTREYNNRRVRK